MSKQVKLVAGAPDIAEFAQDMSELGPFTANELAVQYLDQWFDSSSGMKFDEAVVLFTPSCTYYV